MGLDNHLGIVHIAIGHLPQIQRGVHHYRTLGKLRQAVKVHVNLPFPGPQVIRIAKIQILAATVAFVGTALLHKGGVDVLRPGEGVEYQGGINGHGIGPGRIVHPGAVRLHCQEAARRHGIQGVRNPVRYRSCGIHHVRRGHPVDGPALPVPQKDGAILLGFRRQALQVQQKAVCITGLCLVDNNAFLDVEAHGIVPEIHAGEDIGVDDCGAEPGQRHPLRNFRLFRAVQAQRHDFAVRINDLGLRLPEQAGGWGFHRDGFRNRGIQGFFRMIRVPAG